MGLVKGKSAIEHVQNLHTVDSRYLNLAYLK